MSLNSEFKEITQKLLDKAMQEYIDLTNKGGGGVNYRDDIQLQWITLLQQVLNENLVTQSNTNTDISDILAELKTLNKNITNLISTVNTDTTNIINKIESSTNSINSKISANTSSVNNVYNKVSNIDTNITNTIKKK